MAPETTTTRWTPLITAGPEASRRQRPSGRPGWPSVPRVEVEEKGAAYYVEVEVPGLTEKDLVLTIEDNTLHISGRRPGGARTVAGERGSDDQETASFRRSISLPAHVDPARVKADIAHGMLVVEIPKPSGPQETHRIPIASSEPATPSEGGVAVATVGLEELHDPESGRLDARRIAEYLDIPLRALADALGKKYTTVHKTPAAPSLQPDLRPSVVPIGSPVALSFVSRCLSIPKHMAGPLLQVVGHRDSTAGLP